MSVRVVARVRPLHKSELDKDVILHTSCSHDESRPSIVRIPNPRNENESFSFRFNGVYEHNTTQQELFDGEVAPTIKHLFNGFDVTIFAYGVTGTGKTHTMRGGKSLADRGVIPRMLSGIYRRGRKVEKESEGTTSAKVSMSYYEIYNDKVFDLFEPPERRTLAGLPLRDVGGKTLVAGLTERPCESLKDFEKLYDQANVNRSTGATKLNAHSSRSHAILCVKLSITTDGQTRTSTASAIDLAGSEDNRRTENSKERLVESSSINKSLFVLAQCVEAISKKASRIPYRESKMTRILSLGQNNGLTIMILNLASVRSFHLDTLSSLNFANRTKKIEVRETENEPVFLGCARPVAAMATVQRQPLRTLTNANHNANVRKTSELSAKAEVKPKLFSVYADSTRKSLCSEKTVNEKRISPLKRPLESYPTEQRPGKFNRPNVKYENQNQLAISQAAIEDMVERKVAEVLAARALDQKAAQPQVSDEIQQRLAALEERIEAHDDDERAEGLSLLLMAKQHLARGEDSSALRMYKMARDHFPGNSKLESKITKLQLRIQESREANTVAKNTYLCKEEFHNAALEADPATRHLRTTPCFDDEDHDYQEQPDDDYDSEAGTRYRTKIRTSSRLVPAPAWNGVSDESPQTPRTRQLLTIVNTRNVECITSLRGVGLKKAEIIVEALEADHIEKLASLTQLSGLRGVGVRTVENMRVGLGVV